MIDTTLGELLQVDEALVRVAAEKLPYAAAHRLDVIRRAVLPELKHFYDQRNALITELGEQRPSTPAERMAGARDTVATISPTSPQFVAFANRVAELAAVPVHLNVERFDPALAPKLEITPQDVGILRAFFINGGPDGE